MKGLGRRPSVDERDTRYLLARRLTAPGTPLPSRKTWRISPKALDQGNTGTCVGHAWSNFLRCEPTQTTTKKAPTPFDIYATAVGLDEWSDNDHEANGPTSGMQSGTSVRAGAEAVTRIGRLKSYLWAFQLQPALEFVLTQGSVVLGVDWYSSFNRPNDEGIIRITPASRVLGGHAVLWRGADTKRGLALLSNSWGEGYGISGEAWIPLRDLETLIHDGGECCTAVEQKLAAK